MKTKILKVNQNKIITQFYDYCNKNCFEQAKNLIQNIPNAKHWIIKYETIKRIYDYFKIYNDILNQLK